MSTQTKDLKGHAKGDFLGVRPAPSRARSVNRWHVALVIALALAVLALSAALVNESTSEEVPPPAAAPTRAVAPEEANQPADSPEFLATVVGEAGPADPEMVALVDDFIADYNATRPKTVTSSHWGPDSVLWADNPWASPEGIGPPASNKVVRTSDIIQMGLGPFSGRDLLRLRAPIWVSFEVRQGGWRQSWIQEWTPDGDVILAMWVISQPAD